MALYCGKCNKLLHQTEFILPIYWKCNMCGIEVYEVSDY